MGKFASKELSEIIRCLTPSSRLILPPMPGIDSGVYEVDGDRYMIVSTDPCTGVPTNWFGWLLIHYAASDVALFGARPELASINLLGPVGTSYRAHKRIMGQACAAARQLGMDIVTGHTGNYPSLSQIVGVCTVQGFVQKDKLITPANSKPGDLIVVTKPLGLETLTNFSLTHKQEAVRLFGSGTAKQLSSMINSQTCVDEALLLAGVSGVHAMHDTTEGGLVAALNEMADTSHLGFEVKFEELPIGEEMKKLGESFKLSMTELLSASSTGGLIAAVAPAHRDEVVDALTARGLTHKVAGKFTPERERIVSVRERRVRFPPKARDPYNRIFFSR